VRAAAHDDDARLRREAVEEPVDEQEVAQVVGRERHLVAVVREAGPRVTCTPALQTSASSRAVPAAARRSGNPRTDASGRDVERDDRQRRVRPLGTHLVGGASPARLVAGGEHDVPAWDAGQRAHALEAEAAGGTGDDGGSGGSAHAGPYRRRTG
jgi:hypothetical protein